MADDWHRFLAEEHIRLTREAAATRRRQQRASYKAWVSLVIAAFVLIFGTAAVLVMDALGI